MHRGVLTVPLTAPLSQVAQIMANRRVHCVVALEEGPSAGPTRVWGIVSDVDLARIALTEGLDARTAGGSATTDVVTVKPADSMHRALELMIAHDVSHAIVVDAASNLPVGVLSTLDVAGVLAGVMPRAANGAYHVAQLMTTNVLTVGPDTPLKEVAQLLSEHRISGVPVVERDRVIGIVSESDIVAKERGPAAKRGRLARWLARGQRLAERERLAARTAGEAMTAPAITIDSWQTTTSAAALMIDRGVNRLPVLRDGKLVGILTRADVAGAFSRPDAEIEREILEDVILRSFWIPTGQVDIQVRGGEVTVTGTVDSDLLVELLPEAVQCVPGVVGVRSELHARPSRENGELGIASIAGFERLINPR